MRLRDLVCPICSEQIPRVYSGPYGPVGGKKALHRHFWENHIERYFYFVTTEDYYEGAKLDIYELWKVMGGANDSKDG